MRRALLLLLLVSSLAGCKTTIEVFEPGKTEPTVTASWFGRGALAVEEGAVLLCVDGEDNFAASIEGFFSLRWITSIAGSVFGGVSPDDAGRQHEVTGFGGCDQLFESVEAG